MSNQLACRAFAPVFGWARLVGLRRSFATACVLMVLPARAGLAQPPTAGLTDRDFFNETVVHDVQLLVHSRDWSALKEKFDQNVYYPADLTWGDVKVRNIGIRSRGFASRSPTKPALRLDFDRYSSDQTFLGLKSMALDNLTQDPSMVKEPVSMALFRRLGIPAPRETYVRLFVNNEYAGLYLAVESIDKGFLGRTLGQDDQGGVENDGYLFEYDWMFEYRFEYLGPDLTSYSMFDPKTHELDAPTAIWEPIEAMIRTINETPDTLFEREVSAYLDLSLFAAHIAIENYLAEVDGILGRAGLANFYFYRFERNTLSRFFPWDKDRTFDAIDYPILQGVAENVLARRILADPTYLTVYLDTLEHAAASAEEPAADAPPDTVPPPGWLEWQIVRQADRIRAAALEDTLKPFSNDEFETAVQELLAFARQRGPFVRSEVTKTRAGA